MGCYGRYLGSPGLGTAGRAGLRSPHSYLIGIGALGSHMWMSNCMILRNSPHHKSLKWTKKTWHWLHYCSFFSHILVWNYNFSCNSILLLLTPTPLSPFSQEVTGFFHRKESPTASAPCWRWWPCWRSPPRWSGQKNTESAEEGANRKLWCHAHMRGFRKNVDSKMPGRVGDMFVLSRNSNFSVKLALLPSLKLT